MAHIRPAAVAGSFYPGEPRALQAAVLDLLGREPSRAATERAGVPFPKLLVVPHAGYVYSGAVAAKAYARLAPWRGRIRRVVLLGPTHRVAVRGLAAPQVEAFETPLGCVRIDQAALALVSHLPQVTVSDRPHAREHALEVQLPFLLTVLGADFGLLPLAVGDATPAEVDEVLELLWGGEETLIVISSDLSHYLPRAQARERDQQTVQRILGCSSDLRGDEACGAAPLNGALRAARRHGLRPRLLDLRNSADTAGGDGQQVVGYAAIAFEADIAAQCGGLPQAAPLAESGEPAGCDSTPALGHALLAAARAEIAGALGLPAPATPDHPRLHVDGASFVTLHDSHGRLRGCVGQLHAQRALGADVRHNALAAAFGDSRFAPLAGAEWSGLQIEVSVLTPLQALPAAASLDAAAALLRPGIDGVVLSAQGRQGTFLPQVWAQLPDRRSFLTALLRKAGLAPDAWPADLRLWRYQVTSFEEPGHEDRH